MAISKTFAGGVEVLAIGLMLNKNNVCKANARSLARCPAIARLEM